MTKQKKAPDHKAKRQTLTLLIKRSKVHIGVMRTGIAREIEETYSLEKLTIVLDLIVTDFRPAMALLEKLEREFYNTEKRKP